MRQATAKAVVSSKWEIVNQIKRLWMVALASSVFGWVQQVQADRFTSRSAEAEVVSPSVLQVELVESPVDIYGARQESGAYTELDLVETVQRAVDWHPSISESVGALHQHKENIREARAGYFPQLSVNLIAGHDTEDKSDGDGNAVQLYASQVLYDFGKVSSEVDLATAGARKSQAAVLQSIDIVARDTAKAAMEVQRYQALLQTSQEQIEGVSAIASLVKMRSDRGASSRSDVLQAQSRMEAARASRQQVQGQLNRWRSTLRTLTGSPARVSLSMEIPESVSSACQVNNPDLSAVPEVLIAEASRAEAMARMEEAKARSWPTLSLDASVNNYLDQEYVDANALNDHESAVFLNLSMPIYQGGRIAANRQSSVYALRAADAAKDAARLSVVRDFHAAQEEADGLAQSLAILGARERAIAETRDLYRKQYSSLGTRTLLDLLNAEQELHQARLDKNNTRYDLNRLQIDCLYNVGALRRVFQLEGREIQGVEVLP